MNLAVIGSPYEETPSCALDKIYMKQKVGTIIEADILRRAKRQAAEEDRPLSELIQDALDRYLTTGAPATNRREAAYRMFCEQPMRITPEQFREVLQADVWDS